MDDQELLQRFAEEQDAAAFQELVRKHSGLVFATCLRDLNGDRALAEDAAQATFIALANAPERVRQPRALAGYLYKTARNVTRQMLRTETRRRRREETAAEIAEVEALEQEREMNTADDRRGALHTALAELTEVQRNALFLHYFEGMTYREIAAAEGCTVGAVKRRVSYALQRLRQRFAAFGVVLAPEGLAHLMRAEFQQELPASMVERLTAGALEQGPTGVPGGGNSGAAEVAERALADMARREFAQTVLTTTGSVVGALGAAALLTVVFLVWPEGDGAPAQRPPVSAAATAAGASSAAESERLESLTGAVRLREGRVLHLRLREGGEVRVELSEEVPGDALRELGAGDSVRLLCSGGERRRAVHVERLD